MGFGLNPSPPGQRVLYSAKVKYNKREHVSYMSAKNRNKAFHMCF